MRELLFMNPVLKDTIWGGSRLRDDFGYAGADSHTGECWGISAHPAGDDTVRGGIYDGIKLSELWRDHQELFGNRPEKEFPLLIKIIDAKSDLSIQVHPDNAYAAAHEHGALGKSECWLVLDCEPKTTIIIGTKAKNHEEVCELIREHRYQDLIREIPVHPGDFFQINPGCLHAIKGGTVILETQQSSDITYRVYDYDRLSDGKPRQLHIQQSMDVIVAPFVPAETKPTVRELPGARATHYVSNDYYQVNGYEVDGIFKLGSNETKAPGSGTFTNVSVVDGSGTADGIAIKKGDHFIIPAGYGECRFEGNMHLICSNPA